MKIPISIALIILAAITTFLILNAAYLSQGNYKDQVTSNLNMTLVAVTPHGHQIYSKKVMSAYGKVETVYVLLRHSDGYPMALSTSGF